MRRSTACWGRSPGRRRRAPVRAGRTEGGPVRTDDPANPQVLAELRRDLGRWLVLAGVPASDRDEIILACNEACANAVEHASIAAPQASIRIAARRSDGAIVVEVADGGAWRDGGAGPDRGRGLGMRCARSWTRSRSPLPRPARS